MDDNEGKEGMFKWSLSGEDIVIQFQHILQGDQLVATYKTETLPDGTTQQIQILEWDKKGDKLLNDVGIQQISTTIYSFLNRSVFLSNLTEARAMQLARDLLLTVNKKLFLDHEAFGLKESDYEHIITELEELVIPSLFRPVDEGERRFFTKTSSENRQIITTDKSGIGASSGLFGGFTGK